MPGSGQIRDKIKCCKHFCSSIAIIKEQIMASLFKNRSNWFLAVSYKGKRITKSLGTTDKRVAKKLKPLVESKILAELIGILPKKKDIPFPDLVEKFLNAKHDWANTTYQLNKNILYRHLEGRPLPTNPTSRAIHIRHINQCWNWGLTNEYINWRYRKYKYKNLYNKS